MDLNDISCGGYGVGKGTVLFSLYDTTIEAVTALDGQKLTLTISDSDVMIFDGYEIVSIEKNSDAVRVRFSKTLDEATAKSIGALEENYQTLHTLVNQNQATTSTDISSVMTAISPIIMRADLTNEEAITSKPLSPSGRSVSTTRKTGSSRTTVNSTESVRTIRPRSNGPRVPREPRLSIRRSPSPKMAMRPGRNTTACPERMRRIR